MTLNCIPLYQTYKATIPLLLCSCYVPTLFLLIPRKGNSVTSVTASLGQRFHDLRGDARKVSASPASPPLTASSLAALQEGMGQPASGRGYWTVSRSCWVGLAATTAAVT